MKKSALSDTPFPPLSLLQCSAAAIHESTKLSLSMPNINPSLAIGLQLHPGHREPSRPSPTQSLVASLSTVCANGAQQSAVVINLGWLVSGQTYAMLNCLQWYRLAHALLTLPDLGLGVP